MENRSATFLILYHKTIQDETGHIAVTGINRVMSRIEFQHF